MRVKRIENEKINATTGDGSITARSKPSNNEKYIDRLINNRGLNDYEKIEAVKRKANQLEERAR